MKIKDRIYGSFEIRDPLLIDLIKSKPIQRLKGINQFGVPTKYANFESYSRFEHSIGVMLLLRKLGASQEEQIAGLLHDVSHTAFSHVYDWIVENKDKEDYQDKIFHKYISSGEISKIFKKHKFNYKKILDLEKFTLLERSIPELCADRVDYALREFPVNVVKDCLKHLTFRDEKIVFDNKKSALLFAKNFLWRQRIHWAAEDTVQRFQILSDLLRWAIKKKIISKKDFLVDDDYVINKLKAARSKPINNGLSFLRKKNFDGVKYEATINKKFRHVDPTFLSQSKSFVLSSIDTNFRKLLEQERDHNKEGIMMVKMNFLT